MLTTPPSIYALSPSFLELLKRSMGSGIKGGIEGGIKGGVEKKQNTREEITVPRDTFTEVEVKWLLASKAGEVIKVKYPADSLPPWSNYRGNRPVLNLDLQAPEGVAKLKLEVVEVKHNPYNDMTEITYRMLERVIEKAPMPIPQEDRLLPDSYYE